MNRLPRPGALSASSRPPCASTMPRARERPSPKPPSRLRARSAKSQPGGEEQEQNDRAGELGQEQVKAGGPPRRAQPVGAVLIQPPRRLPGGKPGAAGRKRGEKVILAEAPERLRLPGHRPTSFPRLSGNQGDTILNSTYRHWFRDNYSVWCPCYYGVIGQGGDKATGPLHPAALESRLQWFILIRIAGSPLSRAIPSIPVARRAYAGCTRRSPGWTTGSGGDGCFCIFDIGPSDAFRRAVASGVDIDASFRHEQGIRH